MAMTAELQRYNEAAQRRGEEINQKGRVVYAIVDSLNRVRYIGTTHNMYGRKASHYSSGTAIGGFLRAERASGREVKFEVLHVFHTKWEAESVEQAYIGGYSRLAGELLLNYHYRCNHMANHEWKYRWQNVLEDVTGFEN